MPCNFLYQVRDVGPNKNYVLWKKLLCLGGLPAFGLPPQTPSSHFVICFYRFYFIFALLCVQNNFFIVQNTGLRPPPPNPLQPFCIFMKLDLISLFYLLAYCRLLSKSTLFITFQIIWKQLDFKGCNTISASLVLYYFILIFIKSHTSTTKT